MTKLTDVDNEWDMGEWHYPVDESAILDLSPILIAVLERYGFVMIEDVA